MPHMKGRGGWTWERTGAQLVTRLSVVPSVFLFASALKVLPPVSRFSAKGGHGEKKQRALANLGAFFDRFFRLSCGSWE